jgi:hypothetical protein
MGHRADACRIKASGAVRKVAAESHDSADSLLEAAVLDRSRVGAATRGSLEMIINAQAADHRIRLDRQLSETARGRGNGGRGSDDEALVRGEDETAVTFELLLDIVSKAGSISGTFILGRSRGGRRKIVDMEGQQGPGMSLLNGPQGRGQEEPKFICGRCRASCHAPGRP